MYTLVPAKIVWPYISSFCPALPPSFHVSEVLNKLRVVIHTFNIIISISVFASLFSSSGYFDLFWRTSSFFLCLISVVASDFLFLYLIFIFVIYYIWCNRQHSILFKIELVFALLLPETLKLIKIKFLSTYKLKIF